jgi:hypothetical protein
MDNTIISSAKGLERVLELHTENKIKLYLNSGMTSGLCCKQTDPNFHLDILQHRKFGSSLIFSD